MKDNVMTNSNHRPRIGALALPDNFKLNSEFKRSLNEIKTGKDLFITGAAGSGKTTLLACLKQTTKKNIIILGPTGLSAVNAGGVTIHSFFKFPPKLVQKKDILELSHSGQILQRLDLLIVDEASMVRADLLDAVDYALRLNRNAPLFPFGGVQVVLFGDLFQLPPVVDTALAEHFEELYQTPYFFSANVFKEVQFHQITLKKNYRQRDKKFIAILNKIRNGKITEEDLRVLNSRVDPGLSESWENCITLTPTRAASTKINLTRLEKLPGQEYLYEALVKGEYDQALFPTETHLRLKVGCQVLMVKNDSPGRRWINGSLGEIVALESDGVKVKVGHGVHTVTPETWENFRYKCSALGGIESETIGSFKQYPIRLAWAITIHKSQGLSFNRVVIDFGNGTFAHGQAYVALSRCRSLKGIVLKRPIKYSDIIFDEQVHRISDLYIAETETI